VLYTSNKFSTLPYTHQAYKADNSKEGHINTFAFQKLFLIQLARRAWRMSAIASPVSYFAIGRVLKKSVAFFAERLCAMVDLTQ